MPGGLLVQRFFAYRVSAEKVIGFAEFDDSGHGKLKHLLEVASLTILAEERSYCRSACDKSLSLQTLYLDLSTATWIENSGPRRSFFKKCVVKIH